MRIVLEVVSGPHAGKRIALVPGQAVRVGRTTKADFATQDTYMSGVHFIVECTQTSCRLSDLNSRNGTLLNDEPLKRTVTLRNGDRIFAGQTTFVAHLEAAAAEQPRAAQPTVAHQVDTVSDMSPVGQQQQMPDTSGEDSITPLAPVAPPAPPTNFPAGRQNEQPFPAKTDYGTVPFRTPSFEGAQMPRTPTPPTPPTPPPQTSAPPQTQRHSPPPPQPTPVQQPPQQQQQPPPRGQVAQPSLESAPSTPKGRLLAILREQNEPLYALVDALNEPQLVELLRSSGEDYSQLYEGGQPAPEKIPYLVHLPPNSRLLQTLVEQGWGKSWGVYLTCSAPLADLRQYYREKLMVKVGQMEFIFRFYEPKFLRETLRSVPFADAAKFFGPVTNYFVEAENPEVLQHFRRTSSSIDLKERVLLLPGT